jgi:hypothetical protein
MAVRATFTFCAAGALAVSLALAACFVSIPAPDGSTAGNDASPDAAPSDAAGDWCSTRASDAAFCEDFDRAGLTRFTSLSMTGGTLQLADGGSSPPLALVASGPGPDAIESFAEYDTTLTASSATLAADVRLDRASSDGNSPAELLSLTFATGATTLQVGVGVNSADGTSYVYAYDVASAAYQLIVPQGPVLPSEQWTRVTLHVTLNSPNRTHGTIDADLAGVSLATAESFAATLGAGTAGVRVGLVYANSPNDGWAVAFDDVTLDVED